MKKIIICLAILFMCSVVNAVSLSELKTNYEKIEQCKELSNTLQGFMGFAISGHQYTYCDPSEIERVCEQREITLEEKQAMLVKAKVLDNQLYTIETERHNWIQGL